MVHALGLLGPAKDSRSRQFVLGGDLVRGGVGAGVGLGVGGRVGEVVGDRVGDCVGDSVGDRVGDRVGEPGSATYVLEPSLGELLQHYVSTRYGPYSSRGDVWWNTEGNEKGKRVKTLIGY